MRGINKYKKILCLVMIVVSVSGTVGEAKNLDAINSNNPGGIEQKSEDGGEIITTLEQLQQVVKRNLYNRVTNLKLRFIGDTTNFRETLNTTLRGILAQDEYLDLSILSWSVSYGGYEGDVSVTCEAKYIETKEQAEEVDKRVKKISKQILTPEMSIDEKERRIHDYVVNSIVYDENKTHYSDYDAVFSGKSICHGYALLTYKLLKEAGIESRIVVGEAGEAKHAWNLVSIRGKWYHLDTTWDDMQTGHLDRVSYEYYNVTDRFIRKVHTWDKSLYPAADVPYDFDPRVTLDAQISDKPWKKLYPDFKEANLLKDVPEDKKFTITFATEIDPVSVTVDGITLVDAARNKAVPLTVEVIGKKRIQVTPKQKLESMSLYYLLVGNKIKGRYGETLYKEEVCPITVK